MSFNNILDILFKPTPKLENNYERKIQFLVSSIILVVFFYILSYIFAGLLLHLNYVPFFLSFCFPLILCNYIITFYWSVLDKKYGMLPIKSPFSYSYQGYVILFTLVSPMFFFLGLSLGLTWGNLLLGLGGAVATVYPIAGMFLRIKTFSENNITFSKKIILPNTNNRKPSKVPKAALPDIKFSGKREITETVQGFGFMPVAYWTLSALLGIYTTGSGFSNIYLHFTKGFPSLEAAIFTIILGLLVQSIYIFPDKLNKIVPIELRSKNGFWFMVILVFVLFGVSQFLIGVVTDLTA